MKRIYIDDFEWFDLPDWYEQKNKQLVIAVPSFENTIDDFILNLYRSLQLPVKKWSWDGFNDDISSLTWLEHQSVVLNHKVMHINTSEAIKNYFEIIFDALYQSETKPWPPKAQLYAVFRWDEWDEIMSIISESTKIKVAFLLKHADQKI